MSVSVQERPAPAAVSEEDDAPRPYSSAEFARLSARYPDLRMELTAQGEIIILAPAASETGLKNGELSGQLWAWNRQTGLGYAFDSSAGFTLPNGAILSPDASWIEKTRWEAVPAGQRRGFAPICPDFVVELRSDTDRLPPLCRKMREYIDDGARLGWLIDPRARAVEVYRPGREVEVLPDPSTLSGEGVLPGFTLDLTRVWG